MLWKEFCAFMSNSNVIVENIIYCNCISLCWCCHNGLNFDRECQLSYSEMITMCTGGKQLILSNTLHYKLYQPHLTCFCLNSINVYNLTTVYVTYCEPVCPIRYNSSQLLPYHMHNLTPCYTIHWTGLMTNS